MTAPITWLPLLLLLGMESVRSFAPVSSSSQYYYPGLRHVSSASKLGATLEEPKDVDTTTQHDPQDHQHQDDSTELIVVRAPLKYVGPYPTISLRFPHLATASQRNRNVTGISLDFVVDTAANVNTLQGPVAQELNLDIVGQSLPGVGAAGSLPGADTFLLGDAQLEGGQLVVNNDKEGSNEQEATSLNNETFTFMTNLTASAVPVASASAGLLSLSFLQCFQGGVEFAWGQVDPVEKKVLEYPSISFHEAESTLASEALSIENAATIMPVPITQLPSVLIRVNGVEMPALLDTGSPITVMNSAAAKAAGVEAASVLPATSNKGFFANLQSRWEASKAASRGQVLTIAGPNGGAVSLVQSSEEIRLAVVGDQKEIEFGESKVYVGDLPGLAALNGIGVDSPPAVVLGMDVLRRRPKMLFRGNQNKVSFY